MGTRASATKTFSGGGLLDLLERDYSIDTSPRCKPRFRFMAPSAETQGSRRRTWVGHAHCCPRSAGRKRDGQGVKSTREKGAGLVAEGIIVCRRGFAGAKSGEGCFGDGSG